MQSERHYTLDEYFRIDEASEVRHEYIEGEIVAMSGGTVEHNEIALNLREALAAQLPRPRCRALAFDVRIATPTGLQTYPDLMAVCGEIAYVRHGRYTSISNPVVIGEVLSRSTREYDRGKKFDLYRSIPTLVDYLLIDQYEIDVEHRWRAGDLWRSDRYSEMSDTFELKGVAATISLAAVYRLIM